VMDWLSYMRNLFVRPTVDVAVHLDGTHDSVAHEEEGRRRVEEVKDCVLERAARIMRMARERGPEW
jgi:hypothetical protein